MLKNNGCKKQKKLGGYGRPRRKEGISTKNCTASTEPEANEANISQNTWNINKMDDAMTGKGLTNPLARIVDICMFCFVPSRKKILPWQMQNKNERQGGQNETEKAGCWFHSDRTGGLGTLAWQPVPIPRDRQTRMTRWTWLVFKLATSVWPIGKPVFGKSAPSNVCEVATVRKVRKSKKCNCKVKCCLIQKKKK